jgi:hypothetical protein
MYLIPTFGSNDFFPFADSIVIGIYSDYLDRMIVCGQYNMTSFDFLDLKRLEIPCTKEIIITLTELDRDLLSYDDTHTVIVSCATVGQFDVEFLLNGYQGEV